MEIFSDGSGRCGRLTLSTFKSLISFIILPAAKVKAAETAASNTIGWGKIPGRQIIAATKTEKKVIRKFTGRIIEKIAVSFSFKVNTI